MPRPQFLWFRCYVEIIDDPKLRRIPPAQRWLWLAVMAVARKSPVPGHLLISAADDDVEPITDEDLADAGAVKLADVRSGVAEFRRMGMLTVDPELGCYVVKHWGDRQFESDEVAVRTRKHRAERNGHRSVGTSSERRRNVPTLFLGTSLERRRNGPREQRADNREQRFLTPVFCVTQELVHRACGQPSGASA